jgi:hypothetical protein
LYSKQNAKTNLFLKVAFFLTDLVDSKELLWINERFMGVEGQTMTCVREGFGIGDLVFG